MNALRPLLLVLAAAAMIAACSGTPAGTPGATAVEPTPVPTVAPLPGMTLSPAEGATVTLGIYSGRPDPTWGLTAVQVARLRELVAALPVANGEPPQGGLGYHGFSVSLGAGAGGPIVVAFHGTVVAQGAAAGTFWRDDTRLVERYLLETGRPSLAAVEIDTVEQALANLLP